MANEKRMIELETLIDNIDWDNDLQKWALRGDPEEIPTVDAVEVVRCKDCKHFGGHGVCHCHAADENGTPIFVREDDFCSYGERRTNETEKPV